MLAAPPRRNWTDSSSSANQRRERAGCTREEEELERLAGAAPFFVREARKLGSCSMAEVQPTTTQCN